MPRCIFCRSTSAKFTTKEHILPESLGGGDWAILPEGLFCDGCQNRFGSSIEQQALADYPFSLFRVFLGIPTKKGKPPWFKSWEGTLEASTRSGQIGYEPSPEFEAAFLDGSKSVMRILAHPIRPDMVCRTLLKMGLEIVGAADPEGVFDSKFDRARTYALYGEKPEGWWYLQCENMELANRYITNGFSPEEWIENVQLTTNRIVDGDDHAEVFHLKLLWMDLIVPLESRISAPTDLTEPEFRIFLV